MTSLPEREILVILDDNKRRLVSNIPADAKVTYGPVMPGKNATYGQNALRIYTSQQNQLAVFVGVKEFRDLSLTVREQKVTSRSSSVKSKDGNAAVHEENFEWEEP